MMIYLCVFVVALVLVFIFFRNFKNKRSGELKGGDLVLLKPGYMKQYPNLPKDYPMHVEKLENEYAVVVYMHTNNREMCQTRVWKSALKKVS